MNIEEIRERVQKIRESAGDPEVAHGMEDDLLADMVNYVSANVGGVIGEMAIEVMKSFAIDFPRWVA